MPKSKEPISNFFKRVLADHPNTFRCDNSVLFCLMCDDSVNAKQSSQVLQHLKTTKHKANVERKTKSDTIKTQSLLTTLRSTEQNRNAKEFSMDLTRTFLKANIALHKIRNPSIVEFMEKYTKFAVPSETTLRDECVPLLYDECIDRMKRIAAGKYIWVSLDETTDSEQRCVARMFINCNYKNSSKRTLTVGCNPNIFVGTVELGSDFKTEGVSQKI